MSLIGLDGEEVSPLSPEYEHEYVSWSQNLPEQSMNAVHAVLEDHCNKRDTIAVRYIAAGEWTGTAFEPLIAACHGDSEAAAKFLGQILWRYLEARKDRWWFYRRHSLENEPVGMEYVKDTLRE